jgi:hypothetical protein
MHGVAMRVRIDVDRLSIFQPTNNILEKKTFPLAEK